MSVIGPPTSPDPFAPEIRPSVAWYWIGGALVVVGIVGGIVWGVVGFSRMMDQIEDFQRVEIPGSTDIFLDDPGGYTIYHEYEGAATTSWRPAPDISITDPSGSPVFIALYGPGSSLTYDYDHEGIALYTFEAPTAGTYEVVVEGEPSPGEQMAIGRSFTGTMVGAVLGALAIGGTGVLVGSVLLIVTAVRRGSAKRKAAAATWGGAAMPPGTAYGFPSPPTGQYPPPPGQYPPPPGQYPPPPGQYPPPPGQYPPPPGQYPPAPTQPGTWPAPSSDAGTWPSPARSEPPGFGEDPGALSPAEPEDVATPGDWTPPIP